MRFDGNLKAWNDDRGFGFIAPTQGGDAVFVHISAFPRDGQRPKLAESLSFEIELNHEGKKRAIRVQRPGHSALTPSSLARPRGRAPSSARSPLKTVVVLAVLIGMGVVGYSSYGRYVLHITPPQSVGSSSNSNSNSDAPIPQPASTNYCDGRTQCHQMTSCAEAKYFIKHCPGTKMDGDNDGIPCEQTLCTGLFGH